jgi:hypothetical protein
MTKLEADVLLGLIDWLRQQAWQVEAGRGWPEVYAVYAGIELLEAKVKELCDGAARAQQHDL